MVDVFAEAHHMHPTDLQALVLIINAERQGAPATPGVLRHALNLTSGAVTGAVDRLVRSGHVRREPDPDDRRQTRLHHAESGRRLGAEFFGPLAERTNEIMNALDVDQLRVIETFMAGITDALVTHRQSFEPGQEPPRD